MYIQRGAWAEINLDAVAHNVRVAKASLKPGTKLCAVVKADAYGHGAVEVRTLDNINIFTGKRLNEVGSCCYIVQRDVTGNINDNIGCALNGRLEKR